VSTALQSASLACVVAGLLSAALVLVSSRDALLSLRVLVDLLVAAGLLRLSGDPATGELAIAAALVALRQLLSGLRRGAAS
jgi:hypothetical protein